MSFPSASTLQRLCALDQAALDFPDLLAIILAEKEFKDNIPHLQDGDGAWLIEYINTVLDDLIPNDPVNRDVLRALGWVCNSLGILPKSLVLSGSSLEVSSQPVASGSFGDIYKGKFNGRSVSVKTLRVCNSSDVNERFCKEVVLWKRLNHPNILPLLGVQVEPLAMVSDWMSNGNIVEYTRKCSDANRLALLSDTAQGLAYLHECNIIHGNLKGSNVLVDSDSRARLAGFGLSRILSDSQSSPSSGGTVRWMAPELLGLKTDVNKPSDIYAYGMVIYEVFAGVAPFADCPPTTAAVRVLSGKRPDRPKHPNLAGGLWELTERCWEGDPLRRPESSEIASDLQQASISQPDQGNTVEGGTPMGTIVRKVSRRLRGVPSAITCRLRRSRSNDKHYTSRPVSEVLRKVGTNGSETSFHSMKYGELDEPIGARVAPSSVCGLLRRPAFWNSHREGSHARDWSYHCGNLSDKVLL